MAASLRDKLIAALAEAAPPGKGTLDYVVADLVIAVFVEHFSQVDQRMMDALVRERKLLGSNCTIEQGFLAMFFAGIEETVS